MRVDLKSADWGSRGFPFSNWEEYMLLRGALRSFCLVNCLELGRGLFSSVSEGNSTFDDFLVC